MPTSRCRPGRSCWCGTSWCAPGKRPPSRAPCDRCLPAADDLPAHRGRRARRHRRRSPPAGSIFAPPRGRLGFGDDHFIVVYDDTGGTIAARLWWMLRDVGHEAVRVLDGGIDAWAAAGHPLNTDAPDMTPRILTARPGLTRKIARETLARRLGTRAR